MMTKTILVFCIQTRPHSNAPYAVLERGETLDAGYTTIATMQDNVIAQIRGFAARNRCFYRWFLTCDLETQTITMTYSCGSISNQSIADHALGMIELQYVEQDKEPMEYEGEL